MDFIRIRGARSHNLKNITLDLPRHQLVVITGLSGSGKSSLAFDTLYAEGQRRYVESLSAYARQFLQLMDKPDVDSIEGLSPAIAIEQKAAGHNPRSTVGTITEIHDYLRLLFARVGTPHCPVHDLALQPKTVQQMVDELLQWPEDTRLALLAPLARERKGEFGDLLERLRAQGFTRLRIDGAWQEIDALPGLNPREKHDVDVVVDRLKLRPGAAQRLAESLETTVGIGGEGKVLAVELTDDDAPGREQLFSTRYACPHCDYALTELEPRLFSFNNPVGACPTCDGLGQLSFFDPKRVVAFPELSLASGAIKGWDRRNAFYYHLLLSLSAFYQFDLDAPFESLSADVQDAVLHGSKGTPIAFTYIGENGKPTIKTHPFEGVLPTLERRWREAGSAAVKDELGRLRSLQPCPDCGGARLRREARYVFLPNPQGRQAIFEVEHLTLGSCLAWFDALELTGAKREVADRVVREIAARLRFLNDVGLNYLSLDRSADTLSGGEAQRIRLASQIGSGLTGVMYVLDEPSIGLHQRDNDRLIGTLRHLRDLGNSVLVVEHDQDMILAADHVVDMGPGAGEHGGQVMAQGTPEEVLADPASLTGRYLSGALKVGTAQSPRVPFEEHWLRLKGCRGNNLRSVDLDLPVGLLTCITGVSGSGKSTLINDTLYRLMAQTLYRAATDPAPFDSVEGLDQFDKVIDVDQSPIGRTPRSNPATYTGLFTPLRELFAGVPEARARGYDAGRFSFNVKGGRCEACQGDGLVKVEMHFLPDVFVPCDVCAGKRYNRETLDVRYRGLNIAEVLELSVDQAREIFAAVPNVSRRLDTLSEVGLGYLRLGQSANTLSGGEAQRVKLSLELSKRDTGRTLYILDEPTTGLHFQDIDLLLRVLQALVDAGNTVVVIEHNLDVIKTADWIIDLGPEGGSGGGQILAAGPPPVIMDCAQSATGHYLKRHLN